MSVYNIVKLTSIPTSKEIIDILSEIKGVTNIRYQEVEKKCETDDGTCNISFKYQKNKTLEIENIRFFVILNTQEESEVNQLDKSIVNGKYTHISIKTNGSSKFIILKILKKIGGIYIPDEYANCESDDYCEIIKKELSKKEKEEMLNLKNNKLKEEKERRKNRNNIKNKDNYDKELYFWYNINNILMK